MLLLASLALYPVTFFVDPKGNDSWSGTLQMPNKSRTDGPLATIEAGKRKLRSVPSDVPADLMMEGVFRITKPITFGPEESGKARRIIGGGAIISGMRKIDGWHVLPNGWWQTKIDDRSWTFSQMFVNHSRRYRARLPKNGFYTIADSVPPTDQAKGHGYDRFKFTGTDIKQEWAKRGDVEILAFHIWDMSRNRIKQVEGDTVTFTGPTGYDANWAEFTKGNRYIVENVREALSEPGEWYLDHESRELTYIPKPGERIDQVDIEAPVAEQLLVVDGASNLKFGGLVFEGTNWNVPEKGRFFPQAEADLGGAIVFKNCRGCSFGGCEVVHTGEYGIEVGPGCRDLTIDQNHLFDLGAGGVKVGQMEYLPPVGGKDPDALTSHIAVTRNAIISGGRIHPAAIGVWVGQNSFISVEDNTIKDFYYTGISVGWSWGYQPNGAHHNSIKNNRITDIGQGLLSDMGGIYTLGPQPGTVISGNRIHDVKSFSYGGWGIYPDEGSSECLIENNCVFRTKSAGFHQHYGRENTIRNNVFAFGGEAQIMRTRAEDHLSFTFERNIVLFENAPLLGSNWSGNNYKLDHNLYWKVGGGPFDFAGMSFDAWKAKGQDVGSIIADPQFVDPEHGDFSLKPSSPAFKLGFKPFPALSLEFEEGGRTAPPGFPLVG